jgi:hypothetical protein
MALNVAGWFGTAIVGTLHTFFPSKTFTQRMCENYHRARRPTAAVDHPARRAP